MFKELFEAFKDLGKLSDTELEKGQRLDSEAEDNFKEVSGDIFFKVISKIKVNDLARKDYGTSKGLETLTVYSKIEYSKMRCFLGVNNSSGYALAHHNKELVSVFSSQKSSGSAIVQDAIRNGAKYLDCFAQLNDGKISGQLYILYKRNGFHIDKTKNEGKEGEPYSIQKGISKFVNSNEEVEPDNPNVVIFMKI